MILMKARAAGRGTMSRYVNDLPTSLPRDEVVRIIGDYLTSQGFAYDRIGEEQVWTRGVGPAIVPQFVKAEPGDGVVHIEVWISDVPATPGAFTGEHDLRGLGSWAVKSTLRYRVRELERRLAEAVDPGQPRE
jgi:hypothetical protein